MFNFELSKNKDKNELATRLVYVFLFVFGAFILYWIKDFNYLFFHNIVELLSVIIAVAIFTVAWNSRRFSGNGYLVFLGIAYLFVGIVDTLHAFGYKGMVVFERYGSNLPTQLWLAARYLEASALLLAFFFLKRKTRYEMVFLAYGALTGILLLSIFYWGVFPDAFVEGQGLTQFKKISEYAISFVLFIVVLLLLKSKKYFSGKVFWFLFSSLIVKIFSEIAFVFYSDPYGVFNMVGHYLKLLSFIFIYKAIVITGIRDPYDLLFRDLRESEEKFKDFFNNAQAGFFRVRAEDGRILECNKRLAQILGYDSCEKCIEEYATVESYVDKNDGKKLIDDLTKKEFIRHFETRIFKSDGVPVWVSFSARIHKQEGYIEGVLLDITEQKRAEKLLKESEEKYRVLTETASDGIVSIDSDGKVIFWNKEAERMFGYSSEEILGKSLKKIIPTDFHESHKRGKVGIIKSEKSKIIGKTVELMGVKKNGAHFPVELSLAKWKTEKGIFFTGILRDISERKKVQEKLLESEEKYRMITETSPDCIKLFNKKGKLLFINKGGLDEHGLADLKEAKKWDYASSIIKKDRPKFVKAMEDAAKGIISTIEIFHTKEGADREACMETMAPVKDSYGRVTGIFGVSRDISESIRYRESLKKYAEELKKFELAMESASDGVIITDATGKILYANKATEKNSGYLKEELIGKTPEVWGGEVYKNIFNFSGKKKRKDFLTAEVVNVRKDGSVYEAEINVSSILDARGRVKFFVGVERDITEVKKIDRAKSEIISVASHQLRTPLHGINMSAEMLLRGMAGELNDEQKEYVEDLYNIGKEMASLVNDFLDVSKLEMGAFPVKLEKIDISKIADNALGIVALKIAEKKLSVKKKFGRNLKSVESEANILKMIFENLISNAVNYTPIKGEISISVKKEGGKLSIVVADTGCGIPKKQQTRIFTKMFRADNARKIRAKGSGLGLYIVKGAVERIGGRVWFESEENKGTIFYVDLPLEGEGKERKNG